MREQAGSGVGKRAQAATTNAADLNYCAKLSDLYQRYLGPEYSGRMDTTTSSVARRWHDHGTLPACFASEAPLPMP